MSTPAFDSQLRPSDANETGSTSAQSSEADLWIFRDGKKCENGQALLSGLIAELMTNDSRSQVQALIRAGELECGLADLEHHGSAAAAQLTDVLATRVCGGESCESPLDVAKCLNVPDVISIAPPEGFTYYALHPLDFARVIEQLAIPESVPCAVIGIRSIGSTLSAMTAAALRNAGRSTERITVRPAGHPYSRSLSLMPNQLQWVKSQRLKSAQFLIVDEGPGRSGSTFLAVAEAVESTGVPAQTITIVGSRAFDPGSLCGEDAEYRWKKFRFVSTTPSTNSRFENHVYAGGGEWRKIFCPEKDSWPESWTQMERLKFLSKSHKSLFKFEGMGRIGAQARDRAGAVAEAGFSPIVHYAGDGFMEYSLVPGRLMNKEDLSAPFLDQVARYCAFRVSNFSQPSTELTELGAMLQHNLRQEFGYDLVLDTDQLATSRPVVADGRMQPHEWILSPDSKISKTDATNHGDNHFFPGPCDIAWDLAGIAVEWSLTHDATDFLINRFRQYSGMDTSDRLGIHKLAYSVFRMGFCKMASSTEAGSEEADRLGAAYHRYRADVVRFLPRSGGLDIQDLLDCGAKREAATLHSP